MGRILPHWRSARRARIRAQSTLPRGKVSPEAAHARRGGVPQRRRGGGDLHVRSDKCASVRGRIFHGKDCGASGTAGYRAREGGGAGADCAESTRKLRDLLPRVLASWEGSRRERNRGMPHARRGGAGADCAQSTLPRGKGRARALFQLKKWKNGTRRDGCPAGSLSFHSSDFPAMPALWSCVQHSAALADAAQPYWPKRSAVAEGMAMMAEGA